MSQGVMISATERKDIESFLDEQGLARDQQ